MGAGYMSRWLFQSSSSLSGKLSGVEDFDCGNETSNTSLNVGNAGVDDSSESRVCLFHVFMHFKKFI